MVLDLATIIIFTKNVFKSLFNVEMLQYSKNKFLFVYLFFYKEHLVFWFLGLSLIIIFSQFSHPWRMYVCNSLLTCQLCLEYE